MTTRPTSLPGVLVLEPKVFRDDRGWFLESYQQARYRDLGITCDFLQDNVSRSARGTLRGLHLQHPNGQAKLVYVLEGEVFDVAVDMRVGSPHFAKWHAETLSAENARQMFIPEGFAHGFCVLSDSALFAYKCSTAYSPADEITIPWNSPEFGIAWPISAPVLSPRDEAAAALALERLPQFAG